MSSMVLNMITNEPIQPSPYFGGLHRQTWNKIMGLIGLICEITVAIIMAPYGLIVAAILTPVVYAPMIGSQRLRPKLFISLFGLLTISIICVFVIFFCIISNSSIDGSHNHYGVLLGAASIKLSIDVFFCVIAWRCFNFIYMLNSSNHSEGILLF